MEDKKAFGSLKKKLSDLMGMATEMVLAMDPKEKPVMEMVQKQIEAAYRSLLISEGILFPASALPAKPKLPQMKYGEHGWVKLTEAQYASMEQRYGKTILSRAIKCVDEKAQKTGNRNGWKDWSLVLHNAIRDDWDSCRTAPIEEKKQNRFVGDERLLMSFMESR